MDIIKKNPNILNLALAGFLTLSLALTALTINSVSSLESEARGKPIRTVGTLSVSPNPATSPAYVTISGSGFKANTSIMVGIGGYISYYGVMTDSNGRFVFAYPRAVYGPCTCVAEAWGQNNKYEPILLNSATFAVLP